MNRDALRTAMHAAVDAFLDALERDNAAPTVPANDPPPAPRRRGVRRPVAPSRPVSETDRAAAAAELRRMGFE